MYRTPMRDEPICVARRMRWLSPPDRVMLALESVRYPSPTFTRNDRRCFISFITFPAIYVSRSVSSILRKNSSSPVTDMSQSSMMFFPATVTARLAGFSLCPWQSGHSSALMRADISSFDHSLFVSANLRSRLLIIPSNEDL